KNLIPSDFSVYLTRRLIPGADTFRSLAAPPMVPVTITARITSIWRSVIICRTLTYGFILSIAAESPAGMQPFPPSGRLPVRLNHERFGPRNGWVWLSIGEIEWASWFNLRNGFWRPAWRPPCCPGRALLTHNRRSASAGPFRPRNPNTG